MNEPQILHDGNLWLIPVRSNHIPDYNYWVFFNMNKGVVNCGCWPAFRGKECRHIKEAKEKLGSLITS